MEQITIEQLAFEVSLMREAQKEYFKYHNPAAMKKSIHHERRVDELLQQIAFPKPQPSTQEKLF